LLDLGSVVREALVKTKVGFNEEIDSLGDDFFVFAVENDSPNHFALFQLAGVNHDLEAGFAIFTNLDIFGVLLNEVGLPSGALAVIGLGLGLFLLKLK
jgi:hypothetical protein